MKITGDVLNSKVFLIIAAFILINFIGFVDFVTGYKLGFSIFYLLPILLVTWKVGRCAGIAAAIFSCIVWVFADIMARQFPLNLFILLWNAVVVRLGFFGVIVFSLSELKKSLAKEKQSARRDFLTGIANSQAFFEIARKEIERARRYKRPLSLAYVDCDDFKNINDCFGHRVGDALLRSLADIIQKNIRATDMVARLGGDEFVMLLPETGYKSAKEVIFRVKNKFLEIAENKEWGTTLSIGIATFNTLPDSVDKMIQTADELMYSAKKNGRDAIRHKIF